MMKTCPHCDEAKDATPEFFYRDKRSRDGLGSWCKRCVNARAKPQTRARVIRSRAWHRATQALVERHKAEFQELYEEARAEAVEEDERLTADPANHAHFDAETVRLRSGRRKPGEPPEARVNDSWCVECSEFHAQDHHTLSSVHVVKDESDHANE